MHKHALTIRTIREGPVCTLTLSGDLDFVEAGGFLQQAALAIDNQTERLVLDLAGVAFLDCAGVRALTVAMRFVPSGCPVIVRSLSPMARRILALLGLDLEQLGELRPGHEPQAGLWDDAASERELAPVEPGDSDLDGWGSPTDPLDVN
jgi:anti-anti-sigma factor